MSEPTRYTRCWHCNHEFPLREIREHGAACRIRKQNEAEAFPRIEMPSSAFKADWREDTFHLTVSGSILQERIAEALREADEKLSEPVVIDWLRSRGYSVEKHSGPISVFCPNCHAKPGERCRIPTENGTRAARPDWFHYARRDSASE